MSEKDDDDGEMTELMKLISMEHEKVMDERIKYGLPIKTNYNGEVLFYQGFPNHEEEVKKARQEKEGTKDNGMTKEEIKDYLFSTGFNEITPKDLNKIVNDLTRPLIKYLNELENMPRMYLLCQMMQDVIERMFKAQIISEFKRVNEEPANDETLH